MRFPIHVRQINKATRLCEREIVKIEHAFWQGELAGTDVVSKIADEYKKWGQTVDRIWTEYEREGSITR